MAGVEQTQGSSHLQGSGRATCFCFCCCEPAYSDRVPKRTGAGGAAQGGLRGHSLRSLPAWQAVRPPWPGSGEGGAVPYAAEGFMFAGWESSGDPFHSNVTALGTTEHRALEKGRDVSVTRGWQAPRFKQRPSKTADLSRRGF